MKGIVMYRLSFPDLVDEVKIRIVAGFVVLLSITILVTGHFWIAYLLAVNYILSLSLGPRFSPLAFLAEFLVLPILQTRKKLIPGPPKRFAQLIGALLSLTILFGYYYFGNILLAKSVIFGLLFFSTLESVVGFCTGCFIFNLLMRAGLIPAPICEKCMNLSKQTTI
jgi:hypothetical protein